jgi:propanol-preferring alcohol dehydrogenase
VATMKAAQIHEDLSLRINEVARPTPGPGEALLRLHAAGVCATDLHILDGMIKPDSYPMTVGHETAGVVESVGDGATVAPGDRVAVYNKIFCGSCEQCLAGHQNICDNEPGQFGFNLDGGYAEYMVAPDRNLVPMPDSVDFATASVIACAGMTAVHAARLSGIKVGDTAVVNGIGGVGTMVLQVAALAGARVLAVADNAAKLDLARANGASGGVVVETADGYDTLPDRIREMTGGRGADLFFELVGTTKTMVAGLRSLAKRGRFVSTGYTEESLDVHPIEFILPETMWISTVAATAADLADAIRLAAEGHLTVPIAAEYDLADANVALENLRERRVLGRQVLTLA